MNVNLFFPASLSLSLHMLDISRQWASLLSFAFFSFSLLGTHRVDICLANERMDISGSPFSLKAFDSNRLIVSDIPQLVTYNHPVEFTVDASKSGEGQLEVAINDGLVPNQVKALGNSKFLFTFTPKTTDPHIISIKFNGHQLPGKHHSYLKWKSIDSFLKVFLKNAKYFPPMILQHVDLVLVRHYSVLKHGLPSKHHTAIQQMYKSPLSHRVMNN